LARTSLIFRYQWRAFWRRTLRTGGVKFYLSVLAVVGWISANTLPDRIARASSELAAGQTASMDQLLLVLCVLWLVVPGQNLNVSLSNDRLRRFPIGVRSLLALKLASLFLSPVVWLATILSVVTLLPLLSARHPLPAILAALFFFVLTMGAGVGLSQLLDTARRGRRLRVAGAGLGAAILAFAIARLPYGASSLGASLIAANPASLVTTIAIATVPASMIVPIATLLVSGTLVCSLLWWSFARGLDDEAREPTAHRATSVAWLPGRLGPLIHKEQRSVRTVLDLWMASLPVLVVIAFALSTTLTSTVRQATFVFVCALNANVTLNCLGLDRPAGLTRYLILPIRGKDLFLAKNVGLMALVALQLIALLAIGAWQSGVKQLGPDLVVVIVLLLTHFAWGNLVSVFEPRRAEPHRFAPSGDPVTLPLSVLIGSAPAVTTIALLQSDARAAAFAIAAIVLLMMVAYYGSLRYAGGSFERRIEFVSRRLG
jgi:hypothetical protein